MHPMERELIFVRNTALALGIPPTVLLQGATACGGSATGAGIGWVEQQAALERAVVDACAPLIMMLEELLASVYQARNLCLFISVSSLSGA